MVQNLYKNWLLVSKIIWEIWITSYKQWKVQKVEIEWATFVQKHILLAKTYTEDLSNITFNYLCENSPNSIYYFWNHKSFFMTHLYYFSSNITYFSQKYPIKVQIFRFSTAWVKIHQISYVIFQTKSEFFFKVWITLQCHDRYWQK